MNWLLIIPATIVAVAGVVFGALVAQVFVSLRRSHYDDIWAVDDLEDFT
jgi:predicted membrane protein